MKETILIVDDTPTNLQVLVRLLGAEGYRFLSFAPLTPMVYHEVDKDDL